MSLRALAVAAVLAVLPLPADARPGRAWAAAKANLPASTEVLLALDLTQLRKTTTFKMLLPLLLSKQPDLKAGLDAVKSTCEFDPLEAIEAVVVGADQDQQRGAMFIAVHGIDEAKIASCMESVANAQSAGATKVVIKREAGTTELAVGADKLYLRWIGKDVLVLPLELHDKAQLAAWTGNKRALRRSAAGTYAAKLDTRAALWAISTTPRDIDGTQMKAGYGTLVTRRGTLVPDLHVVMTSAAEATATAAKANQELQTTAAGPQLDDRLKTLLQSIRIAAAGAEVIVRARIVERDLLALAGALMRGY